MEWLKNELVMEIALFFFILLFFLRRSPIWQLWRALCECRDSGTIDKIAMPRGHSINGCTDPMVYGFWMSMVYWFRVSIQLCRNFGMSDFRIADFGNIKFQLWI